MKLLKSQTFRCALLVWLALLLPLVARAHIGSPNIFFNGKAGAYELSVIIRPPATLPGVAQIDVRVIGPPATNVLLQPSVWEAGQDTAPAPTIATAVAGEPNLFNGAVWLMRPGSYTLRVSVEGAAGQATVLVPMNSVATQRPVMGPNLRVSLVALGLAVLCSAIWLVGAAARDTSRAAGASATASDLKRGRVFATISALLLLAGTYAGANRWRTMDREFRNNALSRPLPVIANVVTNGSLRLLRLSPAENRAGGGWDTLVADHGKLMHLFLIHEPDLNTFAHLHPVRRDSASFENVLPPLPAGPYLLYAEVTHENGLNETLTANLNLPNLIGRSGRANVPASPDLLNEIFCQSAIVLGTNSPQPFALDMDDSWHRSSSSPVDASKTSRLMNGYTMTFLNREPLIENRELSLRFAVSDAAGGSASLQPYMGMLGHAVVRRSDGAVFTHLHPMGTISMAAQALLTQREPSPIIPASPIASAATLVGRASVLASPVSTATSSFVGPNEVSFPYAFPRPGNYRLWVQVRIEFRALTGVFDLRVAPSRSL